MSTSYSPEQSVFDENVKPGEFVLQTLFLEFCTLTEKKIEQVLAEPLEKTLTKSLQRGDDQQFDQLLTSLSNVAEQSLPSLLRSLFRWYERQLMLDEGALAETRLRHRSKGSKDYLCERRDLAVEFVYCLVLIEVLTKLSYHPGHDDIVGKIISQAFKHFKYKDGYERDSDKRLQTNPNAANINIIADLYAEVIGVLVMARRFTPVRKTFLLELRELKLRDQTPYTAQSIISLLMGLKFYRVKMHPIEDFEQCVQFLHDLGHYYLEVKDRDIKHALASLFVEILLPVAANAKHEVNVPVLKNFVDMMFTPCVDMTTKRKHSQHMFPLVTCLLCVSQKTFFLNNWPYFLTNCLSQLKNRDAKMSRIALESLSRLLWVYMVRIKCESNQATASRLQSVVSSLFPKGTKVVTPKDMPLNIFVKIIQFIATERLDFAMKEIIFDLMSVGKKANFITPERMSIGLRAFLVIADSLQQGDGDPPMPQSNAVLPSGATIRVKKTFLNKTLTEDMSKHIGLSHYVPYLLKTFDTMLRALDLNVGRPLLLTKAENANKEPEDLLTGDRKPKMDLFRTCIAAIPRLIPDGMNKAELVELVSRLTVHFDEELRGLAFQALQNLMLESDVWKEQVVRGFVQFIQRDISDTNTQQLDSSLRLLMQIISKYNTQRYVGISGSLLALHEVEGLAIVMLCNHRVVTRKLAAHLLKEVRSIFAVVPSLSSDQVVCTSLLQMMDEACQSVVERLLPSLPLSERTFILNSSSMDLQWLLDRSVNVWNSSNEQSETPHSDSNFSKVDPWMQCIATFVSKDFTMTTCPLAVAHAWPIVFTRLNALYTLLDPNTMINENRGSSFIRSGSKKVTTEKDLHMQLWQNYVILACSVAQTKPISELTQRCVSPEPGASSEDKAEKTTNMVSSLFKQLVPIIKCESADMRDTIVNGLGYTNPAVFKELMEELVPLLKEAIERKTENIKRRRKRDVFRVQLAHVFELMAEHKTFAQSESAVIDKEEKCLSKPFVEYIDGARLYLEGESDRDLPTLQDIRLHFSRFVRHLICNTPAEYKPSLLTRDLRYSLFDLFASWSGKFSHTFSALDKRLTKEDSCTELELAAVRAMSAVVCCGPVFDANGLNDDGYIYHWLDTLLSSHDDRDRTIRSKIYDLAKDTVVLLLDFNSDNQGLLDWVIDRCYTGTNEVSDGCFNALAAVFQTREYPCDHVAMLNLAILNVGNPRISTHETAVQLLHLLDRRFFQEESVLNDNPEQHQPLNDVYLSVSYCKSQNFLSDQLARLHPDLTMPIFSEITHRFQTAKPSIRQTLLKYLEPWLHNLELVDPSLPQSNLPSSSLARDHDNYSEPTFKPPLKGEGWGSQEATKMVLNNMFYITVKFGDDHPQELEALWAALVECWPNNIRVVMHYLVIIINMAAAELLPRAKRVISYIGRARPERLVDELMAELQTVEVLNLNIERTQTPPFFRLSVIRRPVIPPNTAYDEKLISHASDVGLAKGTLHTKRHSANPDEALTDTTTRTNSTQDSTDSSEQSDDEMSLPSPMRGTSEQRRNETNAPYPLPMPAYGGYFAPLSEYLPDNLQSSAGFHRSNIAIMFMSDMVLDGLEIDWSAHLPLMLHVIFLGLDHNKELVYEHCKKLMLNLMLLAANQDCPEVARLLLCYQTNLDDTLQLIEAKDTSASDQGNSSSEDQPEPEPRPLFRVDSSTTLMPGTPSTPPTPEQPSTTSTDPDTLNSVLDIVKAVLDLMRKRRGRPLWCYEDITPKTLVTQSAEQLEYFLRLIVKFFKHLLPLALVEQRWSQMAMQLAISCSSRHYAGRSFQVLRALHIRPSSQMLSHILSRLVETVAEPGEDMQGYVTEIILTLEAVVDNIDLEVRPIDYQRDIFMSTPNLAQGPIGVESRRCGLMAPKHQSYQQHHARSTSYSVQSVTHKITSFSESRNRSGTELESRLRIHMPRSRSEKSLKNAEQGMEDKLTIVTQMFWIAVSLLESDYEYEFMLASKLLDKILQHLQPDRPECREKLEKIQQQIKWTNFPGVQTLLFKGCTSQVTAEATWQLLTRLTVCINSSVIDPTGCQGFPMNVIALLPYLVHNYENPSQLCRDSADHISQICAQRSNDRPTDNLGKVMSLYSHGTFGKDSFQWTKCVVKYLHDVYAQVSVSMVTFLVEVLEKGPHNYQLAVLQILHCMVHYVDLNTQPSSVLNEELFHTVAKHVQGPHWKEAIKILKLTVARSSTLTAASASSSEQTYAIHKSFAEIDVQHKKELPGRTLDFAVDLSGTSIIGRKYLNPEIHHPPAEDATSVPSNQSSLSRKGSGNDVDTCWKKPQNSQARTRERLTELLACYGQKRLPKSPSVIFSQSSDTLDHQQSIASSGEDSCPDIAQSSDGIYSVDSNGLDIAIKAIKNFDFLGDYEDNYEDNDYFSHFDNSRRHSINAESPDPDHPRQRSSQFGSTPDLALLGKLALAEMPRHGISTESINIDRDTLSGRESVTSTPEESIPQCTTPCSSSVIVIQNPGLMEERESSPLTASTHSISSVSSDPDDMIDLGASASSSTFPNFSASYMYLMIQQEEVDEMWKQHWTKVMSESSVTNTISTSQIFPRLYRELRRRLATLTKDAFYYISKTEGLKNLGLQLLQILDTMFTHLECPYFFVETDMLMGSRVVDKHKFCLLEMQDCFKTYCTKKDLAEQSLEVIKSQIKQQSLGDGGSYPVACSDEQKHDLCQKLYDVIFKLVQLFQSYLKLLDMFRMYLSSPQVNNVSGQVESVKEEINGALSELENGQVSPMNVDSPKSISKQDAFCSLAEYLKSQQYQKAIQLLRSFRSMWQGDMFGQTNDDDLVTLLNIYCSSMAEKKPGLFVLTKMDFDVGVLQDKLLDTNQQLCNWSFGSQQPPVSEENMDLLDSSTL